ncbi:unnamed protein product [Owenia fusiformis]|uniref:Uncharacterized protein n=1 Tax=Owenia fusiformis TaxID=6347 RepID=A0A8J1TYG3_OWEFU|nr:unnamed protein product [Owenia fusiformis]
MAWRTRIKDRIRIKNQLGRETLAEFIGTFILLLIGDGSVAQSVLSRNASGAYLSVNLAWGLAVTMGVFFAGGVSGGHINPAVSLTNCILGRLPWFKLLPYMLAQYLGAFTAAAVVFAVYNDALNNFDGGVRITGYGANATAGIFSTFPKEYVSTWTGLGDQIVGTALLVGCIQAITDKNNFSPSDRGIKAISIGFVVLAIGLSLGHNCGYAINPARDLGPRILTSIAGWGVSPFSFRNYNWFWVPIVGPHIGAILGAWMYLLFSGIHSENDSWQSDSSDLQLDAIKGPSMDEIKRTNEINGNVNLAYVPLYWVVV